MQLIVTLIKNVEDTAEGEEIYELVKQRMQNWPDMRVVGHVANHFIDEPEEPPS